jgi:hypothetical protein
VLVRIADIRHGDFQSQETQVQSNNRWKGP